MYDGYIHNFSKVDGSLQDFSKIKKDPEFSAVESQTKVINQKGDII